MYMAEGHMLPWGIYGHWSQPDEPEYILGYWCMWHYEVSLLSLCLMVVTAMYLWQGAPIFPLTVPYKFGDIKVYPKHPPYKVDPEWFERYERERELGEHYERHHGTSYLIIVILSELIYFSGWWMDPPPQPEQVALPALDAWGF
ncbi:hypothetical protein K439DRAFT_1030511 [Ramaria rubella]|nr:hypothetical protein K439DRAFT_1030511 [Ramaria rubella]